MCAREDDALEKRRPLITDTYKHRAVNGETTTPYPLPNRGLPRVENDKRREDE